ncbi:MAG: hypothetical protein ACO2ZD_07195, partial [Pseudomonadales bacterium]
SHCRIERTPRSAQQKWAHHETHNGRRTTGDAHQETHAKGHTLKQDFLRDPRLTKRFDCPHE